ncbi:MAG TPA: hypothetical protein VM487_21075 [Phycisphaerae bacterium]|nr:hypothetical protein [Phycisphaerae bacterium]
MSWWGFYRLEMTSIPAGLPGAFAYKLKEWVWTDWYTAVALDSALEANGRGEMLIDENGQSLRR